MSDFYRGVDLDLQEPGDMYVGFGPKHRIFDGHHFRHLKSLGHKLL